MRIKSIELTNIRCFEHIKVEFGCDGQAYPWTVILGDNSTGKSTLLRSIALAHTQISEAQSLIMDKSGPWTRQGAEGGSIVLTLDNDMAQGIDIFPISRGEMAIPFNLAPDDIEHLQSIYQYVSADLFVCGYGATRHTFGAQSFSGYSVRDATATLFNYDAKLQNPELILRRIGDQLGGTAEILALVDRVLMLPEGSTRLGPTGLEVNGPWGDFKPAESLGDGFRATLAWILDFLGWVMYRNYEMLRTGVEGIMLVDEIEQHLHPSWQRRILKVLHEQFPKVQFIVTTHSSLCVVGTTDFEDNDISLTLLQQRDDKVEAITGIRPPRGLRADQILTSYLFGLETTSDNKTKYQIERLSDLLSQPYRTSEEEEEVAKLRADLNAKLGSEETELERNVARATSEALQSSTSNGHRTNVPEEAVDLEVRRQLQELFGDR